MLARGISDTDERLLLSRGSVLVPGAQQADFGAEMFDYDRSDAVIQWGERLRVERPAWLRSGRITPIPERAPRAFAAYLKLVRATSRFNLDALEPARSELGARSVIVGILHRESLLHFACPYPVTVALLGRDQGSFGLYAYLARSFSYELVEQVGPMPPLRQALELLARPSRALVVAVDGPAGPSGVVKRGVVELARLSGAPLVPIRCFTRRTVQLTTTWDRRLVPLPCSTIVPVAGSLLEVARSATRGDAAELAQTVAATLTELRAPRPSR